MAERLGRVVKLDYTIPMREFIESAATGVMPDGRQVDEVAVVAPRGEGKSWACLGVTLRHSQLHEQAGFRLPVPWFWFRDTFPNAERTLLEDVKRPEWQGLWKIYEGGRRVQAELNGGVAVLAWLFGLEDSQAVERLRGGCVGVYGEEPAPAVGTGVGIGWSEASWTLALSSQGRDTNTHYSPAVLASNYPDKHHWFWRRFCEPGEPQCGLFRIASGDRTTDAYRQRLGRTLASQPAMYKRLFLGEPAPPQLGDPVVTGYREAIHYTRTPLPVADGPLRFGWDFWHHPACVIASLSSTGQLRIHFAQRMDRADVGMLIEEAVRPWLAQHNLLERPRIHTGDPSGETGDQSDRRQSAVGRLRHLLPGTWTPSTNDITTLQAAVNETLRRSLSTGAPALLLGPDASELDSAFAGGWFLNEHGKPIQHGDAGQYAHVGMAASYLVHAVFGTAPMLDLRKWALQSAYVQPWDGASPGQQSPSPAAHVVLRQGGPGTADYRAKWARQYQED